jgi:phage gpG-like protein
MTPEQFESELKRLEKEFKNLYSTYAPKIIGNTAVKLFKQNFQDQGFFEKNGWKEVKRREDPKNFKTITRGKNKGEKRGNAWARRPILTGKTGDLGRSIEVKEAGNGKVVIWTNPNNYGSKEPYGRVHNEGLKAGRGSGFTMPKRQFMGDHPELRKAIVTELERKLKEITNK